jgi:hypothetical protein
MRLYILMHVLQLSSNDEGDMFDRSQKHVELRKTTSCTSFIFDLTSNHGCFFAMNDLVIEMAFGCSMSKKRAAPACSPVRFLVGFSDFLLPNSSDAMIESRLPRRSRLPRNHFPFVCTCHFSSSVMLDRTILITRAAIMTSMFLHSSGCEQQVCRWLGMWEQKNHW